MGVKCVHTILWSCRKLSLQLWLTPTSVTGEFLKPPLHRAATFVPPLCDHKNGQDAQWSPEPRKFCFCVTAAARPLCLPWTTKAAVVAQQVVQRRQSEGRTITMVAQVLPWSLNGGTVVAIVIAQWTPLDGQRRHNGGIRKADVSLKLIHNVRIFYWATNGRPLCIHSATTAMCVLSSCLLWATCERPSSSATFVRLFWTCSKLHGDHGVHGDVWTSYVPPLNDQGNRSASLLPSTATWPVLWSHKGGTKVAAPV